MTDRARQLLSEGILLRENVRADVFRGKPFGYGAVPDETLAVTDLITTAGRNFLASRLGHGDTVASAMAHMAIGSGTTSPALSDTALGGEIKRKPLAIGSAGGTAANVWAAVCTFGGAADSLTSVAITEAGILNHASSGNGTLFQRVTFAAVTLADSDLVRLTLETNVGST